MFLIPFSAFLLVRDWPAAKPDSAESLITAPPYGSALLWPSQPWT